MERPKDINHNRPAVFENKRTAIAIRLIIAFHLIGAIGLSVAAVKPVFLQLVPYHLLLMMLILVFSHDRFDIKLLLFFASVFIMGFMFEWRGVHTGRVFGNYTYGKTLGIKLDNVPLITGANWFLLIYAAGVSLQQSRIKNSWVRVLAGALVLVLLDIFIEPVAVKLDYWHWANNTIPVKNYISWFIISAMFLFLFELFKFKKQSIAGLTFLICQFIFFLALLSES
jgi:putative membrane protein